LVALIYNYHRWTLLAIAAYYCLSGIVLRVYSLVRHKKMEEDAAQVDSLESN